MDLTKYILGMKPYLERLISAVERDEKIVIISALSAIESYYQAGYEFCKESES